jgi:hypothetical protein
MRERMRVLNWWLQWADAWRRVGFIYLADCRRGRR